MIVRNTAEINVPLENVFQSKGRTKILKLLAQEGELNISALAQRTKINHNSTRAHLIFLTNAKIVQEKKFGRVRIYRFRTENVKVRAMKNLFEIWEKKGIGKGEGI